MVLRLLIASLVSFFVFGCNQVAKDPVADVVQSTIPSVVRVYGIGSSCSGFYVGNDLFITAAHCIESEPYMWIQDQAMTSHISTPVIVDHKTDLATLRTVKKFTGRPLKIKQGLDAPRLGTQIITFGYPAYYENNLIFEVGFVKDAIILNDVDTLISNSVAYPGQSGGCVVSSATGEVVGMVSAMTERVQALPDLAKSHQHTTLSFLIGSTEIVDIIKQSQNKE